LIIFFLHSFIMSIWILLYFAEELIDQKENEVLRKEEEILGYQTHYSMFIYIFFIIFLSLYHL
jgi:hypothetical protein